MGGRPSVGRVCGVRRPLAHQGCGVGSYLAQRAAGSGNDLVGLTCVAEFSNDVFDSFDKQGIPV